jgi:hypothetical protein
MTFTGSTIGGCKLLLATTLALGMLTTVSQAYSPEQEQMCTGDAMRLCSSEIPDVERVTACMVRQQASLSPGCKAVFHKDTPAAAAVAATPAPVSYKPASTKPGKPMNLTPARVK